jgi:hypothetical protein
LKTLRPDQIADLSFYMREPRCLNLGEPGTGKTGSVVVNQFYRATQLGMRTAWVMPKQLIAKNLREICEFTPFTSLDIAEIDGSTSKKKRALRSSAKILLLGPDRLKLVADNLPSDVRALDVDEIHMCFGGAESGRTNTFYEVMSRMEQSVFMTGTLVNGRLDTAFPAINVIDPRYYPLGYQSFLADHAHLDNYGNPYAWHSHDRIRQILGKHAIYRTFKSVFGEQEIVPQVEWLKMNDKQRELYDTFAEQAYLELEDFMINGTLPGVATIRARQIMEHPNQFPNLMDKSLPPVDICPGERPAKLDALEIHFEDHRRLRTPVMVFSSLVPQQHEIAALGRRMGLRTAFMGGETSASERNEIDQGIMAGKYDLLSASPKVCTVGFNWQFWGDQEIDHVINANSGYWDSDITQGYKRAIRQKRSKPLRITTMAYLDSVDPRIMAIVERKSRDAHLVEPTRDVWRFEGEQPR